MLQRFASHHRWVWSCLGALMLWTTLAAVTGRFSLSSLSGIAVSVSFLVIPALGQTLVVTAGKGNIDLSIAGVITLSAFVGTYMGQFTEHQGLHVLAGVAVVGLATGLVNALLVVLCRIPSIIATLATGYVLATGALLMNRTMPPVRLHPATKTLATGSIGAVPCVLLLALAAVGVVGLLLNHTVYGRKLAAVGQNFDAACLAGVNGKRIMASTFVASSTLAAFTGLLLSAYVNGAFLDMGGPYVLQSIGAVVLGGSLIFGGASTALGTLFGSAILVLIVTTTQIAGLPPGAQDVVQGAVIIGVLFLAAGTQRRSRTRPASPGAASASKA